MKNQTNRHPRPTRQAQPRPAFPQTPDPLAQHPGQRRNYTDFLTLAFYPGMRPAGPAGRSHAA